MTAETSNARGEWVLVPRELLDEARNIAMEWTVRGRVPECGKFGQIAQDLDAMLASAPPSAPVGVEGLLADLETIWHSVSDDKETNAAYQRLKSALAQQPAAVDGMAELVGLLDEVRSHFTRDDDLPDDLLPRIDAALAAQPQGDK